MPPAIPVSIESPCPCGSTLSLKQCCLPLIKGQRAPTAESLMRSRYTAHTLSEVDYLWDTWCPRKRKHSSKQEIKTWADSCEWRALQIIETLKGKELDTEGLVTFIAHYRHQGEERQHHETSLFKKDKKGWLYISHLGE
jgi:SEC-C motif domain protein